MKKLIASLSLMLAICFAAVGLSACKKKGQDQKPDLMQTYAGTWKLARIETWDGDNLPDENIMDLKPMWDLDPSELDDGVAFYLGKYVTLNANGTYESNLWYLWNRDFSEDANGNYVPNENIKDVELHDTTWTVSKDLKLYLNGSLSYMDANDNNSQAYRSHFFTSVWENAHSVTAYFENNELVFDIHYFEAEEAAGGERVKEDNHYRIILNKI